MCGIAGAVGVTEVDAARGNSILEAIEHRGPDDYGSRWADGVWLGFRRLAILDLRSVANQPMVDAASGVAIVFNGEIYNYVELRTELESRGRRFTTRGDTEVLLQAWLEWGPRAFERCNGMWALAIHDQRRRRVVLCRDRFGEKPLHVARGRNGAWWFCSELAGLLAVGAGTGRLDVGRARGFLTLGDVEDPEKSYVEGIVQLPPGTWAELTPNGLSIPTRWWDIDELVASAWASAPPDPEEVRAAVDASVRLRLRSDVPVGTSLSGGVDSSAVVASIRAIDASRTCHAFTASFPGSSLDEWDRAARVAQALELKIHRVEPTIQGFLDEIDELVGHQGGPIESPTVYAQWCVMRAARDAGVTVLLDGQGADETWGGYPKYVGIAVQGALIGGRPGDAAQIVRAWWRERSKLQPALRHTVGLLLPPSVRRGIRKVALRSPGGVEPRDPQGGRHRGPLLARAAAVDLGVLLLPRLLRYADRNSMAWSREVRLPYLDPDLVRLGLRSGWEDSFRQGWTKLALRCAIDGRVPDEVTWRRDKVAYATPDEQWLLDPRVAGAVAHAHAVLRALELVGSKPTSGTKSWRVLSLARFVDRYGLRP